MLILASLVGRRALVTVAIPDNGVGEVTLKAGAEVTAQLAVSTNGAPIARGREVVIGSVRGAQLFVEVIGVVEPEGVYR